MCNTFYVVNKAYIGKLAVAFSFPTQLRGAKSKYRIPTKI
jgi:hypothetical protein